MTQTESFAALVDRLGRIAHALQFSTGLNPAQWEALRYLARANRYSASPSALAQYLGTTKGTVSQTLIALETKGYIKRIRGERDGRTVRLDLTGEGRAVLAEDPLRVIEEAGGTLPEGERAAMMSVMADLIRRLCDRQGTASFGVCDNCDHLEAASAPCTGGCRPCTCGLTGERLDEGDFGKICIDFRPAS